MTKEKILSELKTLRWHNFIFLLPAGMINAFGVTVFLAPVKLYDSGISGTSMLLSQITPEQLTLSVFLVILNVPLFIFGYILCGKPFPDIKNEESCSRYVSPCIYDNFRGCRCV